MKGILKRILDNPCTCNAGKGFMTWIFRAYGGGQQAGETSSIIAGGALAPERSTWWDSPRSFQPDCRARKLFCCWCRPPFLMAM